MEISMKSYQKYLKLFIQAKQNIFHVRNVYVNNNRKMNYSAAYNLPRKEF